MAHEQLLGLASNHRGSEHRLELSYSEWAERWPPKSDGLWRSLGRGHPMCPSQLEDCDFHFLCNNLSAGALTSFSHPLHIRIPCRKRTSLRPPLPSLARYPTCTKFRGIMSLLRSVPCFNFTLLVVCGVALRCETVDVDVVDGSHVAYIKPSDQRGMWLGADHKPEQRPKGFQQCYFVRTRVTYGDICGWNL